MHAKFLINDCKQKVSGALKESGWPKLGLKKDVVAVAQSRRLIGRYTAAVAAEFQVLLGGTYAFARHEIAQLALKENIRCEMCNDHIGMLYNFACQAKALPTIADREWVRPNVEELRRIFCDPNTMGLVGVTVLGILENTSELFIPVLTKAGKIAGVKDFTYTNVHGEADIAHSNAFVKAMNAEWDAGYKYPGDVMGKAATIATNYIIRIFAKVT